MKVIQAITRYFPQSYGGTEVYVDNLAQGLQLHKIESVVAAAEVGRQEVTSYDYNGVEVYRYPVFPSPTDAQFHQKELPGGFNYFSRWLKAHKADLYHQHSWHWHCGLHHLALAKKIGMPTVLTVHMPDIICLRGTLMLNGLSPCEGLKSEVGCGYCYGVPEKVPEWAVRALSQIPLSVATAAKNKLLKSPTVQLHQMGRALGLPSLAKYHLTKLRQMEHLIDQIVTPCQWSYDALIVSGLSKEKLVLCRQGVSSSYPQIKTQTKRQEGVLRIGFLGRWHTTKGVEILVKAVQGLPTNLPVELVIHGILQENTGRDIRDRVLEIATRDSRIRIAEPLSRSSVPEALASFDLLAVPSQWLETGPLVVLEAQAVGTPVIGSNLGGIAELVRHGVDGWLVPAKDVQAWTDAIATLAKDADLLAKLRQGIQPVRTMDTVASEMSALYHEILKIPQKNFVS